MIHAEWYNKRNIYIRDTSNLEVILILINLDIPSISLIDQLSEKWQLKKQLIYNFVAIKFLQV